MKIRLPLNIRLNKNKSEAVGLGASRMKFVARDRKMVSPNSIY
jgi:hypothetical protein